MVGCQFYNDFKAIKCYAASALQSLFLVGTKLSDDSRKYSSENTCTSGSTLSKVALSFSTARAQIEKEHDSLLRILGTQVFSFRFLKALLLNKSLNKKLMEICWINCYDNY